MKTFVLSFLFFSLLCQVSQTSAQNEGEFYRYGLQFAVSDNFNLTNFQGSSISGKYFFNKNHGVRLNLSLKGSAQDNEYFRADTLAGNRNDNNLLLQISVHYLWSVLKEEETVLYFLGGPLAAFNFNEVKVEDKSNYNSSSQKNQNINFGAVLGVGAEYFFIKNMSLNAEYNVNFIYSYNRTERNVQSKDVTTTNSFLIQPVNVVLGLSVYF